MSAGRAARVGEDQVKAIDWDKIPNILFFFFFAPFIIFSVCGPEFVAFGIKDPYYRAAQVGMGVLLLITAINLSRNHGLKLSGMAKFIAIFLAGSVLVQLGHLALNPRPTYNFDVISTVILFLVTFLSIDIIARRMSFEDFARACAPMAFALLVIAAIHQAFFAIEVWGRDMYFGMQPNLGGEIVFGCVCVLAFARQRLLRFAAYALALFCLLELESRAAILGSAMVIFAAEVPRSMGAVRAGLVVAVVAAAAVSFVMLVNPSFAQNAVMFVMDDVLLMSNPYRGGGSGFAGREETWALAIEEMQRRPLTGSGLMQSGVTLTNTTIHNGFMRNLAEFGVPGMIVNLAIFVGAFAALKQDIRLGAVIFGCAVLYFFAARNFGLNIFPFLMWIAILPWANPLAAAARNPAFAPGPRPAAAPAARAF